MKALRKGIRPYYDFSRQCLGLISEDRPLFALFICLSLCAAVVDGIGISLLVPVLESQGSGPMFSETPILAFVSTLFEPFEPVDRLKLAAAALLVVVLIRGALQYAVQVVSSLIPLKLSRKLSARGYAALMAVEIGYVHKRKTGVLVNDVRGHPARVASVVKSFGDILWSGILLCIYVVFLMLISWQMTLFALVFVLGLSFLMRKLMTDTLRITGRRLSDANAELSSVIYETLNGMKLIRLSVAEDRMWGSFDRALAKVQDAEKRNVLLAAAVAPSYVSGAGILIAALLFVSVSLYGSNVGGWLGRIILFLFLLSRIISPVVNIAKASARMQVGGHAFEKLQQFFKEAQAARQPNGTKRVEQLSQGVELENVSFSYSAEDGPVLKSVSLRIPRGEMVALVGPSGAGKTTLVALIARLFDPQEGRILVDGVDLRELDVAVWRRCLSVVSQDVVIFNDTVLRNICFGREDVPFESVRMAAHLSASDEFIDKLPEGYDTLLGERGVRLSGGQQQRISIARAILTDPELLILDEATSHLDSITERAIHDAVESLRTSRTLLVIAHRLSTIREADRIIVMDDGHIVEEGTHEGLMEKRGSYWDMIQHQRLDIVDANDGADSNNVATNRIAQKPRG